MAKQCLMEYKQEASKFKITYNLLVGGAFSTTKSLRREQPLLAKLSTHLFTSQYTWLILIQWNCPKRHLQSLSSEECDQLEGFLIRTRSTITFASSSTSNWMMPRWDASTNPSLKAQNLAMILVATPIYLIQPLTHFP